MASRAGRYRVAFDGEIYNFRALAVEVKAMGHEFNEHADTAVLGPPYDLWGPLILRAGRAAPALQPRVHGPPRS